MESNDNVRGLARVAVSGGASKCSCFAGRGVGLSSQAVGLAAGSVGPVVSGPVGLVVSVGALALEVRACGVRFWFRHLHQGDRARSC